MGPLEVQAVDAGPIDRDRAEPRAVERERARLHGDRGALDSAVERAYPVDADRPVLASERDPIVARGDARHGPGASEEHVRSLRPEVPDHRPVAPGDEAVTEPGSSRPADGLRAEQLDLARAVHAPHGDPPVRPRERDLVARRVHGAAPARREDLGLVLPPADHIEGERNVAVRDLHERDGLRHRVHDAEPVRILLEPEPEPGLLLDGREADPAAVSQRRHERDRVARGHGGHPEALAAPGEREDVVEAVVERDGAHALAAPADRPLLAPGLEVPDTERAVVRSRDERA